MSNLLKVNEVADALRVDATTVTRWIRQGVLDAILLPQSGKQVQQKYLVKQETLNNILNQQAGGTHV